MPKPALSIGRSRPAGCSDLFKVTQQDLLDRVPGSSGTGIRVLSQPHPGHDPGPGPPALFLTLLFSEKGWHKSCTL